MVTRSTSSRPRESEGNHRASEDGLAFSWFSATLALPIETNSRRAPLELDDSQNVTIRIEDGNLAEAAAKPSPVRGKAEAHD